MDLSPAAVWMPERPPSGKSHTQPNTKGKEAHALRITKIGGIPLAVLSSLNTTEENSMVSILFFYNKKVVFTTSI